MMKKTTVIKFGGSIAQDPAKRTAFLKDLAALAKKAPVVLVHGGGPEINAWLKRLALECRFVDGLRYTDENVLEIVEMALSGKVNKALVGELNTRGVRAVGISGKDGKTALCRQIAKLGFVGEPVKIDTRLVTTLLKGGFVPVLSSLGFDKRGRTLNVNADTLAMSLACALKAQRLVFLTDVPGVLDGSKKTIPAIRTRDIGGLVDGGIVTGGMIPKVKSCARAVTSGVREVWIIEGSKGLKDFNGTVIKR